MSAHQQVKSEVVGVVEFLILGPLEVRSSGEVIHVAGIRQRKLLALLLLNVNRVVPIDRLIDELWESPPRSVRQQIHNAVGGLRGILPASRKDLGITRTDAGYQLDLPEESLDVHRFLSFVRDAKQAESLEQLPKAIQLFEEALELWRGDALAGLEGAAIANASANLNEQRLTAIEDLMALRLATGEASSLVGQLRQLVADHPLRESLRGSLMLALHRSGRQADALAVYDEGRSMLADELGLDPTPQLRQLHAAILSGAEETNNGDRPAVEAMPFRSAASRPTKSYLPHDTRDFSGRSMELAKLLAEAQGALATALVISAIDGMGGVGKTTLAVHLAHQVAKDYPHGQYFVDLHGFSPGVSPMTPEQALDALLRDRGVPPELVPNGLEGRSAVWRSHMAGQRALLVLDNAIDAAQVRPLLPGAAGVLVLVTSRRKLAALEGAVPMSLDVLPFDDAIALFTLVAGARRVEREPDAVAAAVELCGYLPLAIRIAAARLRDRTIWTVSDLVNRLRNQTQRRQLLQVDDRSVNAVLLLSYRYLPPQQQLLFRLLSLHPGTDFDAYTAAALTGYRLDHADYCLEALFDVNLLKQNAVGRFHFHDLVHDCSHQILMETVGEHERQAALQRLFDYYLHAVHTWCKDLDNRLYNLPPQVDRVPEHIQIPSSVDEAVELLAMEYQNLISVARFTAANNWHRHAWQLACALQPLLRIRNYGEGSYDLFQGGLQAARRSGSLRGESACLQGIAMVCRERRSTAEAMGYLKQALELSKKIGDQNNIAAQLVDLGSLYVNEDRLNDALTAFRSAEALMKRASGSMLRAAIDNNLGVIYRDLGQYDLALDYLRQALAVTSGDGFSHGEQLTSWSIGAIFHFQGKYQASIREFDQILRASTEHGFEHGQAIALLGLSGVYRSLNSLRKSLDLGRQALALARKLEIRALECEALIVIGEVTIALEDLDRAEKVYEQAEDHANSYAIKRYAARTLEGFAHIALARGQVTNAKRHWEQAIQLYPERMTDADYPRRHLASLDDRKATCFRCEIAGVAEREPARRY